MCSSYGTSSSRYSVTCRSLPSQVLTELAQTPIHILSCRCTQNTLPAYSSITPGGIGSQSPSSYSTFGATPGCSFNHAAPALQPVRGTSSSISSIGRSSSANHAPGIATLEQNMLFARLVAGEETPAGEVPPTYQAVISHDPSAGTDVPTVRSASMSSDMTTRGRRDRSESVPRGRSSRAASDRGERSSSRAGTVASGRGERSSSRAGTVVE